MAASRIRFYESAGLIEPAERQANGYREYPSEALLVLEIIDAAKCAGFSLDEIKPLLPSGMRRSNREKLVAVLEKKVADIAALQKRLNRTRDDLVRLLALVKEKPRRSDCAYDVRQAVDAIRSAGRDRKNPAPRVRHQAA